MPRLLVSNGDDRFVGKLIESLAIKNGVDVTALVAPEGFVLDVPGVASVTEPGDQTHLLLTMPIDDEAARRAIDLIDAVDGMHLLFIATSAHAQDQAVMEHMKASGKAWTIVRPVSMMDVSLAALPPQVAMGGVVFGISGTKRIGFVAASDIMRVLAVIIAGQGHAGQEYVCTGPEAVDMPTVVARLSQVLGRPVDYIDLPEPEMKRLMVQYGRQDPGVIERLVMGHLRTWRDGLADVVTTTVRDLTGTEPLSVTQWFAKHRDDYPRRQSLAQRATNTLVKARYRDRILSSG